MQNPAPKSGSVHEKQYGNWCGNHAEWELVWDLCRMGTGVRTMQNGNWCET